MAAARSEAPVSPLKLPKGVRTLIVFGGAFDPPHEYHARWVQIVQERLYGASGCVVYVPAARSPLKEGPVASDAHRLAMLRLALRGPGKRVIWTDELDRAAWERARGTESPSYTIDTLKRLARVVQRGVKTRLLIGADQVAAFHRWKDYREVIRRAEPLVMPRGNVSTVEGLYTSLHGSGWEQEELAAWCTRMAPAPLQDVSSTDVRRALARAKRSDPRTWQDHRVLGGLNLQVARYIVRHGLYRGA
ncbi:Nicotinate-nucleotide adenylyltransferase [Phycisphaerales bacterium]|nr:Nicotinate-nucleotide adenylyltransferase [Phycisphaerales bacterium]